MQSEFSSRKVNQEFIDVCRHNLVECILSDVPFTEGYGPTNLISNNFIERSKGFLAERFIKPPVYLTLEFKSEIDIQYIAITCSVGAQKSKGLELFSQAVSKGYSYESVASGVLPEDKIGFVFHRFNVSVKDRFGEKYCFRTFKSSRFLSLVNKIRIKIFCTSKISVPALGKIEIWGTSLKIMPSKHALVSNYPTMQTQTLTREGLSEHLTAISCKPSETIVIKPSHLLSVTRRAEIDQSFSIPDDFIDPITCDIMIQPLILPSGKIIDSSTLISHEKAELKWGRGPSDPFTGVPFSNSNKPIVASDLKSRIDKFLSDNCNIPELQNTPRTLGRNSSLHMPQKPNSKVVVSKLVTKTNLKSKDKCLPIDQCFSSTGPDQLKLTRTVLKRKYAQIESDKCSTLNTLKVTDDSRNNVVISSPSSNVNHFEAGLCKKLSCSSKERDTFQERMEQSLELALKSTLSKLPKFTSEKIDPIKWVTTPLCYACKSIDNLFSIPCNHFVCRTCLLQVNRDISCTVCLLCSCGYKTSDVQKVHTR